MTKSRVLLFLAPIVLLAGGGLAFIMLSGPESLPVTELSRRTHIHGLAVDRDDPSRLLAATHDGLFTLTPDGMATRTSKSSDDFMGFTAHSKDAAVLYASGHPASGGNLGLISSTDGGKTWRQLSKGAGGPADFHQMDVSKADPKVIYGVHDGLQVSRDGGRSFEIVGPAPNGLIDLVASSRDADTLFAATQTGLFRSTDAGRTWRHAYLLRKPATLVETTADGTVYVFIAGVGLIRAMEPSLEWTTLNQDFGGRVLIHLAADPADANKLYAVTQHSEILASADGGRAWRLFGAK